MKQGRNQSVQKWHGRVRNGVNVLKDLNIKVADKAIINQIAAVNGRAGEPIEADHEATEERSYAIRFIRGSRFTDYKRNLKNTMLEGTDRYPTTLLDAYTILQRWESLPAGTLPVNDGIALATNTTSSGADGGDGDITSNNQYVFAQRVTVPIPLSWLVLDSAATDTVFCNPELLSDIRTVPIPLNIIGTTGSRQTNLIGDYPGLGTVWLDRHGIANIVSLHQVKKQHHITYDSVTSNKFVLTDTNGNIMSFSESNEGLYYYDTNDHIRLALINTVKHIKASYTDSDYHRALAARQLQIKIGRPSIKDFKNIIMENLLPNCPVTQQDIDAAEDIFGPDVGSLKGKTTRRRPHKVKPLCADPMALAIKERYRQVTICADVMHIN